MKKLALLLSLLGLISAPAFAADAMKEPIKIGELFCYTGCPGVAEPWRQGWEMALDEVNKSGGVLGRQIEVVSRNDMIDPAETVKRMEELKIREGINLFFGTLFDHTTLAASSFAKQNNLVFIKGYGGSNALTGKEGHDFYFQISAPNSAIIGVLAEKAATSGKKRWAITAADYEFGRSAVEVFQRELKRLNPSVEFTTTQWFPLGKMDAGPIAQTISRSKPDGIFNIVFLTDYLRFVREGRKRDLFDNRLVVTPFAGYSSYIEPLGKEAPVGWFSGSGYPVQTIVDPKHKTFIDAYKTKYGKWPDVSVLVGYNALKVLADAIRIAGTDDAHKVSETLHSARFDLPDGELTFRADGISNRGDWFGYTGFLDGVPTILKPEYIDAAKHLPTVEENMKSRMK